VSHRPQRALHRHPCKLTGLLCSVEAHRTRSALNLEPEQLASCGSEDLLHLRECCAQLLIRVSERLAYSTCTTLRDTPPAPATPAAAWSRDSSRTCSSFLASSVAGESGSCSSDADARRGSDSALPTTPLVSSNTAGVQHFPMLGDVGLWEAIPQPLFTASAPAALQDAFSVFGAPSEPGVAHAGDASAGSGAAALERYLRARLRARRRPAHDSNARAGGRAHANAAQRASRERAASLTAAWQPCAASLAACPGHVVPGPVSCSDGTAAAGAAAGGQIAAVRARPTAPRRTPSCIPEASAGAETSAGTMTRVSSTTSALHGAVSQALAAAQGTADADSTCAPQSGELSSTASRSPPAPDCHSDRGSLQSSASMTCMPMPSLGLPHPSPQPPAASRSNAAAMGAARSSPVRKRPPGLEPVVDVVVGFCPGAAPRSNPAAASGGLSPPSAERTPSLSAAQAPRPLPRRQNSLLSEALSQSPSQSQRASVRGASPAPSTQSGLSIAGKCAAVEFASLSNVSSTRRPSTPEQTSSSGRWPLRGGSEAGAAHGASAAAALQIPVPLQTDMALLGYHRPMRVSACASGLQCRRSLEHAH
jgi:hypothetical protein